MLFSVTIIALSVWLSILFGSSPLLTDPLTKATFFASLFLWLTGLLSFISIYFSSIFYHNLFNKIIINSVFQSTILSATIIFLIILNTLNVLGWLEFIVVLLLLLLVEIYLKLKVNINIK